MRLIAWHDEVSYDEELGGFLFWGFKAEGDINAVAKKMNAVLPASGKLVNAGDVWVRAEVRMIGDPADAWRPNRAGSGTVTPKEASSAYSCLSVTPMARPLFFARSRDRLRRRYSRPCVPI